MSQFRALPLPKSESLHQIDLNNFRFLYSRARAAAMPLLIVAACPAVVRSIAAARDGRANFGEGGARGLEACGDKLRGFHKFIPENFVDVRLDENVGGVAPELVGRELHDRKRTADDFDRVAGLAGEDAGFQVDRNDDLCTQVARADGRYLFGEKAVDEDAILDLDRLEEPGIGAGGANRRADFTGGAIGGFAGEEIGGDDAERNLHVLEAVLERELAEEIFEALVRSHAHAGNRPAPEIAESGRGALALHLLGRSAARVGGGDQRAYAGPGDAIDGNAVLFEGAKHANVSDASRETAAECDADARPVFFAGISERTETSEGAANPFENVAQVPPLFDPTDLHTILARSGQREGFRLTGGGDFVTMLFSPPQA
jgi:hypothetical protein